MPPMPLVVCLCCNLQWHTIFYFRRHRDAPGAAGTLVVPPWCSWYHESDPLTPSRPALALSPRRKVWGIQEGSKTAATLIYSKNTPWSWPPAPPTPIWMQPNWTYTHFLIFLALFRPHQFLRNFLNFFFGLAAYPILAEFIAPIGFLLWPLRLELYSFSSSFLALSRPHHFFRKNLGNFFDLAPSSILAEFNAPISFCLRPPRLNLYSF